MLSLHGRDLPAVLLALAFARAGNTSGPRLRSGGPRPFDATSSLVTEPPAPLRGAAARTPQSRRRRPRPGGPSALAEAASAIGLAGTAYTISLARSTRD